MRVGSKDTAGRVTCRVTETALATLLTVASAGIATAQQSVTFEGSTFINQGLVGVARVPSNARDQFGDTLGGFGSAMAMQLSTWHKNKDGSYGGTLLAVPDRGWNTQGTVDYPGRVHSFNVTLQPFTGASTNDQNQLTMDYQGSVLLHEADGTPGSKRHADNVGNPTTGIDPLVVRPAFMNFPDLLVDGNNRISVDDEGIVLPGDGTMWISDEYGPYVYHYDQVGRLLDVIRPPDAFIPMRLANGAPMENFSANSPPIGANYNLGNPVSGRQNNQGFEGLALSPDGKTLFVLLQSALIQDLNATSSTTIKHTRGYTRLLAYDLQGPTPELVGEYVVHLPQFADPAAAGFNLTAAQSEMHALNDHQFLVLARDSGNGFSDGDANSTSLYRSIDLIDISQATNIANTKYDSPANPIAPNGVLDASITPAAYQPFLNINDNSQLNRFNLHNGLPNDKNDLYEKWESITIVPALDPAAPNDYFLLVGSDNDFITTQGWMVGIPYTDKADVDTLVLVYRVTLPTYVSPQPGHGKSKP